MLESQHIKWLELMNRAKTEGWTCLPSPPDERDWPLSRMAEPVTVPASVRLDGLVTRIMDQGRCGLCAGFSGAQIGNIAANQQKNLPDGGGLSPLFLYTLCKQEDGIPNQEGTFPRVVLKVMERDGITPEKLLPYTLLDQTACLKLPTVKIEHLAAAAPYRIKAYARLQSVDEMKQALAGGKLILGGILTTTSFHTYNGSGLVPLPEGTITGMHAIVICGYDDAIKAFRMINSWGTTWGDGGFAWLGYDFCNWQSDMGMTALNEAWAVEFGEILQPSQPDSLLIEMWIGSKQAKINGVSYTLDVAPEIKDGRTMLPARFIAEAQGCQVDYTASTKKIEIRKK